MQMDAGLDTGAMRLIGRTPVDGKTAGELTDELADMGAALMVKVLDDLHAFAPEPQPGTGATYAAKIDKSEARLDFLTSAVQVERQLRAFNTMPGAFFELEGDSCRLIAAAVAHPAEQGQGRRPGRPPDPPRTTPRNP